MAREDIEKAARLHGPHVDLKAVLRAGTDNLATGIQRQTRELGTRMSEVWREVLSVSREGEQHGMVMMPLRPWGPGRARGW